jgi:hypothetical protein
MTQEERSAAIDERREEARRVRKALKTETSEQEQVRLNRRLQMLEHEAAALLRAYNGLATEEAWGNA